MICKIHFLSYYSRLKQWGQQHSNFCQQFHWWTSCSCSDHSCDYWCTYILQEKRRRLNTPAYVYYNEVETLDNPAYVSSLKLAEKSGGSTLDFNFECSQHFTAEENLYATID